MQLQSANPVIEKMADEASNDQQPSKQAKTSEKKSEEKQRFSCRLLMLLTVVLPWPFRIMLYKNCKTGATGAYSKLLRWLGLEFLDSGTTLRLKPRMLMVCTILFKQTCGIVLDLADVPMVSGL
ncbi:unnamed protein product [Trifolium pratense]|uniref:Uncharacterized protein n=1 Tax=Trifolium pratense TaxID=57577 RepID=A0ACB0M5W3_TRIPR|nr:unnamed protein product [Trifolium pratense]